MTLYVLGFRINVIDRLRNADNANQEMKNM